MPESSRGPDGGKSLVKQERYVSSDSTSEIFRGGSGGSGTPFRSRQIFKEAQQNGNTGFCGGGDRRADIYRDEHRARSEGRGDAVGVAVRAAGDRVVGGA